MDIQTLHALAEPNRLRILELLREHPYSVNMVADKLGLRQPQASKHLKTLTRARLVTPRQVAQQHIYALNPKPLQELSAWLTSFEQFWTARFEAIDQQIKDMKEL